MYRQESREEYLKALKDGQRTVKSLLSEDKAPYPAVLDQILPAGSADTTIDVGLVEIPAERIVGTKSAGRTTAFSARFQPLLPAETEFAAKWIELCAAHLSEGIRDPIVCFEYLGEFYVQEGNKRVSVLRHFGAPRISAQVRRILPPVSDEPRIAAYYEFLEFFKATGLYQVQFRRPGDYAALLAFLGKNPGEGWDERETRTFSAYYQYFRDAFDALGGKRLDILPEEALLLWLQIRPFKDLGELSGTEIKRTLFSIWDDVTANAQPQPVELQTEPVDTASNIFSRFISGAPGHVNVAFVHPLDAATSGWIEGHDRGRQHLERVLGDAVTVRTYNHADTPELAEALLQQAVADGADVVFSTTPQLSRSTLRIAVEHPKVRFFNCSLDSPYSSIRTYYGRIYEAKFITGAIAGAMANNDRIGYIGSSPIFGVPAAINAFALGAQITNPRAKIVLRWSCQKGAPQADFFRDGIRVVSNRDMPTQDKAYLNFCNYGTYFLDDDDTLVPLGSPVWLWGKFYETVIRSILAGTWDKETDHHRAVNHWWGMDSGVIDIKLADHLPEGMQKLAEILRKGLKDGSIDPFKRRIVTQDGTVINDGSRTLNADELMRMDWLCDNVEGYIPEYDDIEPFAQPIVRMLGIHREQIPLQKEGSL